MDAYAYSEEEVPTLCGTDLDPAVILKALYNNAECHRKLRESDLAKHTAGSSKIESNIKTALVPCLFTMDTHLRNNAL
jgi:hypothetical protein